MSSSEMTKTEFSQTVTNLPTTSTTKAFFDEAVFATLYPPAGFVLGASFLGALGNAWFLLVIVFIRSLHKPNYRLLLGVIIYDLIFNIFFIPFETSQSIIHFATGGYVGSVLCLIETPIMLTCAHGSLVGQFLVAVNRGVAVFKPLLYRIYMTNRAVVVMFFFVAFLFPCVFFFALIKWEMDYGVDAVLGDCVYLFRTNISKEFFTVLFSYIPVFGSLIIYACIVARIAFTAKDNRTELIKRARGSFNMFICMFVFAICYISIPISRSMGLFTKDGVARFWITMFSRLSFSLNPLFYVLFDTRLRQGSREFIEMYILRKSATQNNDETLATDP